MSQKVFDVKTPVIQKLRVEELLLDPQNPRLPEELLGKTPPELLEWLEESETLEELASSMLANGFFAHEPLVVKATNGGAPYVVVEGNRRFATLSILLQLPAAKEADVNFDFEVEPTKDQLARLWEVPCLVVDHEDDVRKFLGFRHIGGLKTWKPEAKARYLEVEVDSAAREGSSNPFKDVGKRVGTNALGVRGPFIALKVLRAARDVDSLNKLATSVLRDRFGVWNRLLNSAEVREFIGLADALDYESVIKSMGALRIDNLLRVLSDLLPPPGGRLAVLQDSRDATRYGQVIADNVARNALTAHGDLDLAYQIVDRQTFTKRAGDIAKSVEILTQSVDSFEIGADEVAVAGSLLTAAKNLNAVVGSRLHEKD
ncbi:ParB N-terminal domain-containing protein [Salinibacterium sp. SWN248]|uniref:ParB N-terminal domain-containing protein n=1 Tax=Salinibacterium sp. SWN248 TaxID=2792056 RepID=UPI0018CF5122|nr:ParB N-terminal domain-containing protein [Salinibacterium sp. SWN248]MBH0024488.1 ParB N-terminal domain-containing protein [Salinibacterium sp. SWN248]